MTTTGATGTGIANIAMDGTILDTWFPHPELATAPPGPSGTHRLGAQHLSPKMLSLVKLDEDRMVEQVAVRTTIEDLSSPPIDTHDAYLRLHLLSHRMVRPNQINLDGLFDHLANVVWTNKGPCLPDNFEFVRTSLRSRGLIHVYGVDVLPRMVDYVVPTGVYIALAERVRLGAFLGPGTYVRREGFVSFNAGTLGHSVIEGRISSGVVLGAGADVGLSAAIMGPDSPEGTRPPLHIGSDCRFGVNAAVLGVELGSHCVIGDGVTLRPHTPVTLRDTGQSVTMDTLAGQDFWHVERATDGATLVAFQQQP
ncbi:DapH/DapD/GlmU-related protein [Corynebacterium choanae]|uniref:2,3,4,5-tetrahydropyridine-2,6-dicarboxylate N-succinyltransferase n=1 Tax=Corynebacterium choanae TaxID=1862358 RepID=A0A3G6J9X1_9CORY|nr:DapH/DapD/GlmU-related protein [Corynebacterium choanae]AZA13250.1 2,3,4,5-tetrahydropyridine-2,6-dicarboxylate N-succinyltransferase [Corynebacterium choanae]